MQKRTRIFAAITVAIGLLLGLAMFASTFFSAAAVPASANNAKKHHHTQTKTTTVTSTVTSTTTSTSTVTPPPPPGPMCFAFPNPAPIGSGTVGSGNPAGNVQFTVTCSNLNPTDFYTVQWVFPTCTTATVTEDGGTVVGVSPIVGPILAGRPDANGHLNFNFRFGGCVPGTGTVTITDLRTGQSITVTVTLAPPSAKHK